MKRWNLNGDAQKLTKKCVGYNFLYLLKHINVKDS